MTRVTTRFSLACLALFLFTLCVTVYKPGLPPTLKADEPAYFLMALSLVHDGDLVCERQDYLRLEHTYPWLPTGNLILMSDDGWDTVLFSKPFLYPLVAAPFAALFGANGLVALNALLFVAMIAMGAAYLERFNSPGTALLFSLGFFCLSPAFAYVFWLQPEILNMAAITASLFLAWHRFEPPDRAGSRLARTWRRIFNDSTRPLWSGAAIAFAGYNKPILGALAIPILYSLWRRRGIKPVVAWCAASILALGLFAGVSTALTGHPTAYLGVSRSGVKVESADAMPEAIAQIEEKLEQHSTTANSWSWMFDSPPFAWPDFREDLGYFFWGRHTGFLPYMPMAVMALLLFLLHNRRRLEGWLAVGAAFALALFFIVKIPLNWHGGGGFVGNRYFINVYPVFLFLITTIAPRWLLALGFAAGGLFLGPIVFTPLGAPVPEPGLQAHTRSYPYELLPLELSIRRGIPGYSTLSFPGIAFIGRKDRFEVDGFHPEVAWVQGAVRTPVLVLSETPFEGIFLEVTTSVPDNRITFEAGGAKSEVVFAGALRARQQRRTVELRPERVARRTYEAGVPTLVYDLDIEIEHGRRVINRNNVSDIFYLGAELRYLGRRDQVTAPEHYRLDWLSAATPETVAAGARFEVPVVARNRCYAPISSFSGLPVTLGYHWLDERGDRIAGGGKRTPFADRVKPGETLSALMKIRAPDRPGRYTLELDAVREPIGWFSERGGATHRAPVRVVEPSVEPEAATR